MSPSIPLRLRFFLLLCWGHQGYLFCQAGNPVSYMRVVKGSAHRRIDRGWGRRWTATLEHSIGDFLSTVIDAMWLIMGTSGGPASRDNWPLVALYSLRVIRKEDSQSTSTRAV